MENIQKKLCSTCYATNQSYGFRYGCGIWAWYHWNVAINVLKQLGIKKLLVIGNKETQMQAVIKLGLKQDCYCDSREQDVLSWIMEHTDGTGEDVIFECVGKNETLRSQSIWLPPPEGLCWWAILTQI